MTESSSTNDDIEAELLHVVAGLRANLSLRLQRGETSVRGGTSPRRPPSTDQSATAATVDSTAPPAVPAEVSASAPIAAPAESTVDEGERPPTLDAIRAALGDCQRCRLAQGRTQLVFGEGPEPADLMFVGEAPGREEDMQGRPFVGAAGQLLTKMIEAMGLSRDEVFIGNIIKCRPPENRDPAEDEVATCEPFLRRQISAVRPRIIVALGNFAVKTLLRTDSGISRLRGRFHAYQGVPLMPTFHPAYLLRNPSQKRQVWEDLKAVMAEMDRLGLERRKQ